jgi:DNA-directed RNA polymerase specialized sigma24 family protein
MSESFPGGGLEPGRSFRTTHWSVVMAARHAPTAESVAALEVLAKTYWMPLYTFIRRRGTDPTEAQDLTQGFFTRLLEKEWLLSADAERGRFRTFLLTALTRFLSDEYDRATALKRGGGTTLVPLDFGLAEERLALEPADGRTPEQAFDRAWAEALLEKVLSRLAAEFDEGGRTGRFAVLKQFLTEDAGDGSYPRAAAELGLSESAVKSGIHRLRRRYGELIHEEIALTLVAEADIDSELEHFLAALGG